MESLQVSGEAPPKKASDSGGAGAGAGFGEDRRLGEAADSHLDSSSIRTEGVLVAGVPQMVVHDPESMVTSTTTTTTFVGMASKPLFSLETPPEVPIRLSKLPVPARYPSREHATLNRCCPEPPESWISKGGGQGWSGCGSYGIDIKHSKEIRDLARWFAPEVRIHSEVL